MLATTQQQGDRASLLATGTPRDRLAIKIFSQSPALGLQVDERELRELLTYPEVSDVVENTTVPPRE